MLSRKMTVNFGLNNVERVNKFVKNLVNLIKDYRENHQHKFKSTFNLIVENSETQTYSLLSKDCLEFYRNGFVEKSDLVTVEIELVGIDTRYLVKPLRQLINESISHEQKGEKTL